MNTINPTKADSPADIAVIGGGVVGCAAARRFALDGASVILIEKGADILSGASKANSAIMHTGFDAPEGSLELECIRAGRDEYLAIHHSLNLPLVETGALVCAWNEAEAAKLEGIFDQGKRNGVTDLRLLSRQEALARMPSLSSNLHGAVEVMGEHVIDPWSAPLAYLLQAISVGARVMRQTEITSGTFSGGLWALESNRGTIHARTVINAAGLHGDTVSRRLGLVPEFEIRPRKGQFVVLDKAAARHVPAIVLPVPTEITKGIVVCPTAFGNVLVGPTAEEQDDRERAATDEATLRMLLERAAEIVPALAEATVTAIYAGLRPATEKKQYRISADAAKQVITLGGIRSTGLSAALGIARHAAKLYADFTHRDHTPLEPPPLSMPNLAERFERDWQRPDHGDIVCHCEMVTRREIEAALSGDLPAGDFGGLRRRTRAGMGRCQGFYCNAKLARMSSGHLATPLASDDEADQ